MKWHFWLIAVLASGVFGFLLGQGTLEGLKSGRTVTKLDWDTSRWEPELARVKYNADFSSSELGKADTCSLILQDCWQAMALQLQKDYAARIQQ